MRKISSFWASLRLISNEESEPERTASSVDLYRIGLIPLPVNAAINSLSLEKVRLAGSTPCCSPWTLQHAMNRPGSHPRCKLRKKVCIEHLGTSEGSTIRIGGVVFLRKLYARVVIGAEIKCNLSHATFHFAVWRLTFKPSSLFGPLLRDARRERPPGVCVADNRE